MFNRTKDDDEGNGGFLSDASLQEMVWQTASVLKEPLALEDPESILQHLSEPMADGLYALRVHKLMAQVRNRLNPLTLPQRILCSSFLLGLHVPLMDATQNGVFCIRCNPSDAVFASHLLLHQRETWETAAQLTHCLVADDEATAIQKRLLTLQQQLYSDPHTHHEVGQRTDRVQAPLHEGESSTPFDRW